MELQTALQAGAKLSVNGRAIGTGDGGRLTGPSDLVYMLSGDAAGTESDTFQTVAARGNTTTTDIGIGLSSTPNAQLHVSASAGAPTFRLSRAATAQIWEQTIDSSNRWHLREAASEGGTQYTRLQIDDAGETLVAPNGGNVGIGFSTTPSNKLDVAGGVAIGASYVAATTAPSNGLLVEGNVGIGRTEASCALHISGNACGSGIGNRLTGPNGVPYLLEGDSPAETQNLQDVTENGNSTDRGLNVTAGGMTCKGTNSTTEIGTVDGYSIYTEQKAALAAYGATISSTGSMIAGGSGHHISGDYDTIAGGALGNISGGDFKFYWRWIRY